MLIPGEPDGNFFANDVVRGGSEHHGGGVWLRPAVDVTHGLHGIPLLLHPTPRWVLAQYPPCPHLEIAASRTGQYASSRGDTPPTDDSTVIHPINKGAIKI